MSTINRFGLLIWLVIIACFAGGMKVEYFWRDLVPLIGLVVIGSVCLLTQRASDVGERR
jgi:hypothetical protein